MKDENVTEYGFYSKLLNKPFDTLEALKKAEEAKRSEDSEKQKLAEVKKARAEEVEAAYKNYLDARAKAKKIIDEARKEASEVIKNSEENYYKLRDKFIEDYKSYHVSYYNDNGNESVSVSDLVDSVFSFFGF